MRLASLSNNQINGHTNLQNTPKVSKNMQPKMQIGSSYSALNMQKAQNPSFGWFGVDDLFYYYNKKLNGKREEARRKQIDDVSKKVHDDVALIAKKNHIPIEMARKKFDDYLKVGGINIKGNGYEAGLNKVIGYASEKLDLIKDGVTPVIISQKAKLDGKEAPKNLKVPNGILFYGPYGRGKSFLAENLLDHFKQKNYEELNATGWEKDLKIKTVTLDGKWNLGDTEENIKKVHDAFAEAKEFQEKENGHTIIFIDNLEKLIDEDDKTNLTAEFLMGAVDSAEKGVTWIGTIPFPQDCPEWLFNPAVSSIVMPIKHLSDPEKSAVMSYFWAQINRQDETNHDVILNFVRNTNFPLFPPKFKKIAEQVDQTLSQNDYSSSKRGNYRAPVTSQLVIDEMNNYKKQYREEFTMNNEETLKSLDDEPFLAKLKEKKNEDK